MSRTVVQMDVCNGTRISAQELIQALILEEELGLPRTSTNVFSIWMCSPLLGIFFLSLRKLILLYQFLFFFFFRGPIETSPPPNGRPSPMDAATYSIYDCL